MKTLDREPIVAGTFYPGSEAKLTAELQELFTSAKPNESSKVLAVVAPHAGYVYSGQVAASSFNQINREKQYDNIFVVGSTHSKLFNGASVYSQGDYITPLGKVKVNTELAQQLIDENELFLSSLQFIARSTVWRFNCPFCSIF